jgi:hypothetical protein
LNLQWSWARLRSRTCREDATLTFFPCHHILANFKRHYYFITNFFTALRFLFLRHVVSDFYERLEFHDFSDLFLFSPRRDAERQALKIDVLYTSSREYRSKRLCVCVQPERRRSIGLYKRSVDFKCAWNPLSVVSRQRLESNNGWPHTCVHNSDKLLSSLLAW